MPMEQPTKERIKQFWDKLGLETNDAGAWFEPPDFIRQWLPFLETITPNILFKYAVPKLQNEGYQIDIVCWEQKGFNVCVFDGKRDNGKSGTCEDDDLSLALFGAIWEVIK